MQEPLDVLHVDIALRMGRRFQPDVLPCIVHQQNLEQRRLEELAPVVLGFWQEAETRRVALEAYTGAVRFSPKPFVSLSGLAPGLFTRTHRSPELRLGLKPKLQVAAYGPSVLFPDLAGAYCYLLLDASRLQTLPQILLQILDPRLEPLHGRRIS